jgi:hypothetical protein
MTYPSITCVNTLGFTIALGSPLSLFALAAFIRPFIMSIGDESVAAAVVVAVVVIDKAAAVDVVVLMAVSSVAADDVSMGVEPLVISSLALSATVDCVASD